MDFDIREISIKSIGLSNRAVNALSRAGYKSVGDIMGLDKDALLQLPALGANTAEEIIRTIDGIIAGAKKDSENGEPSFLHAAFSKREGMRLDPEYKDSILQLVSIRNPSLKELGLTGRPLNQLINNGFADLSDIIFLTESDLQDIPAMGSLSISKILECLNEYISENEEHIRAIHDGDMTALWDDDLIRQSILSLYAEKGFGGFSYRELKERLDLPREYPEGNLKSLIGRLIADEKLEYVDYRLYRRYRSFEEYIEEASVKNNRDKKIVIRRLSGETLAEIGDDYDLTRERVRQIIAKTYKEAQSLYLAETGLKWFDEEYYTYFYKTYAFDKKEGAVWFNISPATWKYLDMLDIRQGNRDLSEAVNDAELDVGLRLKVKNYINRNSVYLDSVWVEKKRADLEEAAVRSCCTENTSFTDFCGIYNRFLEGHGIAFDEKLYITDEVRPTRKNHLPNSRKLLWKQNETIRYYDIDSRDYSELLEELELDSFENIEISTAKLMEDHADIMKRYDIRDQYELHNLLRKIVPEGSYHDFKCRRMPMILFGTFDRDAAVEELLIENAPIEANAFADLIHDRYGYDQATVIGTYFKGIYKYLKDGVFTLDHKVMDPDNMAALKDALTDDFYYISEVKDIYKHAVPNGDPEDVNSYNLRSMGFSVISDCILQNYSSLEVYYEHVFTETEIVDLGKLKKRYSHAGGFYPKMMEMKRSLKVIEFEPDKGIVFSRLERSGVTREQIHDFCDKTYAHVGADRYFSAQYLRESGFTHELYDFGFSDWFYANLLISDDRFSFTHTYGNIILYTGDTSITITSFLISRVQEHGSVDMYDLINELEEMYGCKAVDRYDVVYKLKGTGVFYDSILDRLYASSDLYEEELEAADVF